ncbi:uncharacterized protein RMCC_0091 [Mycolicibacterium canariasense]|uniref:Uncharacterized protein n=1 Tax=Mycolicibacterium canariasense TaxID=228230 RepID=A0A117I8F9_MYCCR|nr:uncharacterized protein RMCC_0091 [Mycolicibacterium canariasense]
MINIHAMSGVRVDGMYALSWVPVHPAAPAVASAHRAGSAPAAANPQLKRRTAAATPRSVNRGTT